MEIQDRKVVWAVTVEDPNSLTAQRPSIMRNYLGKGIDVLFAGLQPVEVVFHKINFPSTQHVEAWFETHTDFKANIRNRLKTVIPQSKSYLSRIK